MTDWIHAQSDPSEELARLHYFSMKQPHRAGEVEYVICVREYATRKPEGMRFFAQADKPIADGSAAYLPFGWGETLLGALTECMRAIRRAHE